MASDLVAGPLVAGTYRNAAFSPVVTLTVGDGWTATVLAGFFDVQIGAGTPEVIAVQVAHVLGVVHGDETASVPGSAVAAADLVAGNSSLTVLSRGDGRLGGVPAHVVEVRNQGDGFAGILDITPGRLGINPGRALWLAFLDGPTALLAVIVGGPAEGWPEALAVARPIVDSLRLGE